MKRLRDYQELTLILSGNRARAIAVAASDDRLWLEPVHPGRLFKTLPAEASVAFVAPSGIVLLTGRASVHPSGCVEFRSTDPAHLRHTRGTPRLPIELPAALSGGGAPAPVQTTTRDIGGGGLYVNAPNVAAPGAEVEVAIELPSEMPDIRARCRVVRSGENGTALQFAELERGEAEQLEVMVIAVRRRFAQHVATTPRAPSRPIVA